MSWKHFNKSFYLSLKNLFIDREFENDRFSSAVILLRKVICEVFLKNILK